MLLAGAQVLSFQKLGSWVESQEQAHRDGSDAQFQQTQFVTRVQNTYNVSSHAHLLFFKSELV